MQEMLKELGNNIDCSQEMIEELGAFNDRNRVIKESKATVNQLRESMVFDKHVLSSEDIDPTDMKMAVMTTNILYDQLGVERKDMTDEELLLSKEGIINIIKKMFKGKQIDLNNAKYKEVIDYVEKGYKKIDHVTINSKYLEECLVDLKILGYDNIESFSDLNTALNTVNDRVRKDLAGNHAIFNFDSMLSTSPLKMIGYKIDEKLDMFSGESASSLTSLKLKDLIKSDAKTGLKVDDYRIVPLGVVSGGYISFYILRYVKNGDLYTMIPRWNEYKITKNIKVEKVDFDITPSDYELIRDTYDSDIYSEDTDLYNPGSEFSESYDEQRVNKELDDYINSLGPVKYDKDKLWIEKGYPYEYFDFVDDWDLKFESDINLCEFVCNVSLANYYDNQEQMQYGSFNIKYEVKSTIYYDMIYAIAKALNDQKK